MLLAGDPRPLTTHPFRDGAPFPLPIETSPTLGRSRRFVHRLHKKRLALSLAPSISYDSDRFSLLSSVPNLSMSHSFFFFISSSTCRSSMDSTSSWFPAIPFHTLSNTLSYPISARHFVTLSQTALLAMAGNLFFGTLLTLC